MTEPENRNWDERLRRLDAAFQIELQLAINHLQSKYGYMFDYIHEQKAQAEAASNEN